MLSAAECREVSALLYRLDELPLDVHLRTLAELRGLDRLSDMSEDARLALGWGRVEY